MNFITGIIKLKPDVQVKTKMGQAGLTILKFKD